MIDSKLIKQLIDDGVLAMDVSRIEALQVEGNPIQLSWMESEGEVDDLKEYYKKAIKGQHAQIIPTMVFSLLIEELALRNAFHIDLDKFPEIEERVLNLEASDFVKSSFLTALETMKVVFEAFYSTVPPLLQKGPAALN